MKRFILLIGLALALVLVNGYVTNDSQAAERTPIILGTATLVGGFELYRNTLAEIEIADLVGCVNEM